MRKESRETLLGAAVVALAAWAVGSAFSSADVKSEGGYEVTASFDNVAGLEPGAEVRMVGLPIGTVLSAELEPQSYRAKVTMIILDSVELTTDTSARIIPDGLTGQNFVSVEPGGEDSLIDDGGAITYTQGSINFIDLLGRFVMTDEPIEPAPADDGGLGGFGAFE